MTRAREAAAANGRSGSFLRNRSLRGLTISQFLGAFNDNLYKQLVLLLAARVLFQGEDKQGIASTVFALPFVLFSGIAGNLSERVSKRSVIVVMKVAEMGVMLGAVAALYLSGWKHQWWFLLAVLFLMGTHSAFFGPSKYGIVPEIVERKGLLSANGVISMTTFLAIITGAAIAGPLLDHFPHALWIGGAAGVVLAAAGMAASLTIRPTPATRPELRVGWNPFGGLAGTVREMRADRRTFTVVISYSFFFFNGHVLQQAVNGMGVPQVLDLEADENWLISLLLVTLVTALMIGCMLAPVVGRRVPASRMIATGALVLVLAQATLVLVGPVVSRAAGGYLLAHAALAVAGFAAAFFVVPVVSFVQDAPEEGSKGKAFAVNNFFNFVFIFLAGGFYYLTSHLGILPTVAAAVAAALLGAYLFFMRRVVRAVRLGPG